MTISADFARLKGVILNALMLIFAHTAIVGQSLDVVIQTADSARTDLIFQINFGKKAKNQAISE